MTQPNPQCVDCGKSGEMLYSRPRPTPQNPIGSVALCAACFKKDQERKKS